MSKQYKDFEIDYNQVYSESDSQTSTTSYEEEKFDETVKAVNTLKDQLIKPVMYQSFNRQFSEQEVDDSFELALLRFLHLVFSVDGVINFVNLTKYMDDGLLCNTLKEYFEEYPGVMNDYEFYYTNAGTEIRAKFYDLLSNQKFFTYCGSGREIDPTIDNLLEFFENYFPKLSQDGDNNQEKLSNIYNQLNFNFGSLEVIYSTYQNIFQETVHHSTGQLIKINGIEIFSWEMLKVKDVSGVKPVEFFANTEFRYA